MAAVQQQLVIGQDNPVPISVCRTCSGSEATMADLEDLCAALPELAAPVYVGCFNACGQGPNAAVGAKLCTGNSTFEHSLALVRRALAATSDDPKATSDDPKAADDTDPAAIAGVSTGVLRRAQLRSDAMRCMATGPEQDLRKAERLLSEALEDEAGASLAPCDDGSPALSRARARRTELRLLRAEVRSSWVLKELDGALADLDAACAEEPELATLHLERGKVLRRARRFPGAAQAFQRALDAQGGVGLAAHVRSWTQRVVTELEEQAAQPAAADENGAMDSGDGSGRWKVVRIEGVSFDSCIYHLENDPPAVPHPHPSDAWHVSVRFGTEQREYTPVSTAADWEQGRLRLLVKTYVDGMVSKKFATLHPWKVSKAACWLWVTVPKLTLTLPDLSTGEHRSPAPTSPVTHLGLVVGGTGVAPALQLLRTAADASGPFGADCRGTLVYSSRRSHDVLMLNELRQLEAGGPGRISVWHTLTDRACDGGAAEEAVLQEVSSSFSKALSSLPCRHLCFASPWQPFKPEHGPLMIGPGEEGGLRGRISSEMLAAVLPAPGPGVRIVVSGPPSMWEDVKAMLVELGHAAENLVELKSLSLEQQERQVELVPQSSDKEKSCSAFDLEDVRMRIEAAKAVAADPEAMRKKATAALEQRSGASESAAQKRSWDTWNTDKWRGWSSGGWSDASWTDSSWQSWKTAKWN